MNTDDILRALITVLHDRGILNEADAIEIPEGFVGTDYRVEIKYNPVTDKLIMWAELNDDNEYDDEEESIW